MSEAELKYQKTTYKQWLAVHGIGILVCMAINFINNDFNHPFRDALITFFVCRLMMADIKILNLKERIKKLEDK